jgi:uncharacterized protein YbjT (DUF2867 family)
MYVSLFPKLTLQVDDVARAIINSLKTEDARGAIYELAGPAVFSSVDLANWVAKVLKMEDDVYKVPVSDKVLW